MRLIHDPSFCTSLFVDAAAATHAVPNGHAALPNGTPIPNGAANPLLGVLNGADGISTPIAPSPATPVSFTPDQMNTLRAQIQAFKFVSKGLPVPPEYQVAIHGPRGIAELERQSQPHALPDKIVDAAAKLHKASSSTPRLSSATPAPAPTEVKTEDVAEPQIDVDPSTLPKGPFLEDKVDSGIYPYNAYVHPFTHLTRPAGMDPAQFATRMQRLLVPSIMPHGLDPHQLLAERNRFIDARIQQRIDELEGLPSTMGDGGLEPVPDDAQNNKENAKDAGLSALVFPSASAHGKLRATIELKGLRVLDKQRELRALVAARLAHGTLLPLDRAEFRRARRPTARDVRTTEQAERRQRLDRERRVKQKHVAQLGVICAHGREVLAAGRAAQDRAVRLGRAVQAFHAHAEKEEQKRIERISKERLKALKADDEEAYMKLIDTAKDHRITHLLKQTDSYLDSLAQAVMAQQAEGGVPAYAGDGLDAEGTNEATFGAQVAEYDEPSTGEGKKIDYYAVAHRIKEKVTQQPSILVGGTLKEYQLKGLQWMVSLYNNKLNGILADEMVIDSSMLARLKEHRLIDY